MGCVACLCTTDTTSAAICLCSHPRVTPPCHTCHTVVFHITRHTLRLAALKNNVASVECQQHAVPGLAFRDPQLPQQQSSHGSDPISWSMLTSSANVGIRPILVMCVLTHCDTYTACQSMLHTVSSIGCPHELQCVNTIRWRFLAMPLATPGTQLYCTSHNTLRLRTIFWCHSIFWCHTEAHSWTLSNYHRTSNIKEHMGECSPMKGFKRGMAVEEAVSAAGEPAPSPGPFVLFTTVYHRVRHAQRVLVG